MRFRLTAFSADCEDCSEKIVHVKRHLQWCFDQPNRQPRLQLNGPTLSLQTNHASSCGTTTIILESGDTMERVALLFPYAGYWISLLHLHSGHYEHN
ncbi:hypothetical protein TNCV_1411501 [Trichonephila clavipes]|nr:hypothetical protein TNCV_1411501 [Trichonephila clavipes]